VGWILVIPQVAEAQQGLKGSGLGGRSGYPSELWDQLQAGVRRRLVAGIPVVVCPVAWPWGKYSGVVWVWNRAVAWHNSRGGEPSRIEQQLCRPTGRKFCRRAVLILDRGVVKASAI
jgi:hypothetical protein